MRQLMLFSGMMRPSVIDHLEHLDHPRSSPSGAARTDLDE
jgi:hypothetical protein